MNLLFAAIGVETLILIAILIGAAAGRQSRDDAWRRIADARRIQAEALRHDAPTSPHCRDCPYRRWQR